MHATRPSIIRADAIHIRANAIRIRADTVRPYANLSSNMKIPKLPNMRYAFEGGFLPLW